MPSNAPRRALFLLLSCACLLPGAAPSAAAPQKAFGSVLVTNDDGIASPGLHALAAAFAEVAERVVVVAPAAEASGSGMTSNVITNRELTVRRANLPDGTVAYAVDGYPVDCVVWGRDVVFGSEGPDLVVSGINTAPNLGAAVYLSGTIGAARMARRLGVPSIAVSGGNVRNPRHLEAGARYAVALAQSDMFAALDDDQYLSLDIPLADPDKWKGVRIALHHLESYWMGFQDAALPDEAGTSYPAQWRRDMKFAEESDFALLREGYLVVAPMTVAEQVPGLAEIWKASDGVLPPLSVAIGR